MDRRNRALNLPLHFLFKTYQTLVSPFFVNLFGGACKYQPTCSQYSHDVIQKYGIIKGMYLSIFRIIRCNPFSKGGYDPA